MRYIQLYQYSPVKQSLLFPVCGNDGVITLDGRFRISRCHEEANIHHDKNPKYDAYQIMTGTSYTSAQPDTDIINF